MHIFNVRNEHTSLNILKHIRSGSASGCVTHARSGANAAAFIASICSTYGHNCMAARTNSVRQGVIHLLTSLECIVFRKCGDLIKRYLFN